MADRTSNTLNVVANYGGQVVSAIANIAFIPLYIRYMGVESYGLVGVFAILTAAFSFFDSAFGSTLNRQFALGPGEGRPATGDLLRSLECLCIALLLLVAVVAWPAAVAASRHWSSGTSLAPSEIQHAIMLMAICAVLRLGEGLYRGVLLGLHRHISMNAIVATFVLIRALGAIAVLRWIAPTIDAFFAWQALLSAAAVLALGWRSYAALGTTARGSRFSPLALRLVWRFVAGILIASFSALALTQLDKVLLLETLPLDQYGYYAVAVSASASLYQVVNPVAQSYYPRLAKYVGGNDNAALAAAYHHACQLVCLTVIPAAAVLHYATSPLILIWSGDPALARGSGPILSVLAIGTMFHCLLHMPLMLQFADGWTSLAAKGNLVAVAVLVPLLLWLVPRFGALGAAYAWLALNIGYVLILIPVMHRRILPGEIHDWYWTDVFVPLAAVAVTGNLLNAALPDQLLFSSGLAFVAAATAAFVAAVALSVPLGRSWVCSACTGLRDIVKHAG